MLTLHAKTLEDLESMTERLLISLQRIGLTLNTKKIQILRYNPRIEDSNLNFAENGTGFMQIDTQR